MTAAKRLLLPAALLVLIAVLATALTRQQYVPTASSPAGQVVQAAAKQLNGQPLKLDAYRGKIVVVNFLAAWCAPCWDELAGFERVSRAYQDRGVQVVGIGVQSTPKDVQHMIDQLGLTFPIGLDDQGALAQEVSLRAMPTTLFLDQDGRVIDTVRGELDEAQLRAKVEALL